MANAAIKIAYLSENKHRAMTEAEVRSWLEDKGFDYSREIDVLPSADETCIRYSQQV